MTKYGGRRTENRSRSKTITGMISLKLEMSKYTTDTFGKKN